MSFLDNLKTITQEGNMETRQITPFSSSTFYAVTVWNIHFYTWKQSKFIFIWAPLGPSWSAKYLNIRQKLPIQSIHHTFLESRHPEVSKNPCHVLSPKWSQTKGISPWTNAETVLFQKKIFFHTRKLGTIKVFFAV